MLMWKIVDTHTDGIRLPIANPKRIKIYALLFRNFDCGKVVRISATIIPITK